MNVQRSTIPLLLALLAAGCSGSSAPSEGDAAQEERAVAEQPQSTAQDDVALHIDASFSLVQEDPVLARGPEGEWDSGVVRFPYVLQHNEQFHMFYEARLPFDPSEILPVAIGYATSTDGINWTKSDLNPIFEADGTGFDALSVSRPLVSVDGDGNWTMHYAGEGEANLVGVGLATASAPSGPWERLETPLLVDGPDGSWDDQMVLPDQIIQDESGFRMYYSGREASGRPAMIGLATSEDGVVWRKFNDPSNDDASVLFAESDPIIAAGPGWDSGATWTPTILEHDTRWIMVYNAFGSLGAAVSNDGVQWQKHESNPLLRNASFFHPFLLKQEDGSYWIYFRDLSDEAIYLLEATLEFN